MNAQEKKQIKGLENLQKRLLRAEKRRQKELVDQHYRHYKDQLLPNQSLEERQRNFSDHYLAYGGYFFNHFKKGTKATRTQIYNPRTIMSQKDKGLHPKNKFNNDIRF